MVFGHYHMVFSTDGVHVIRSTYADPTARVLRRLRALGLDPEVITAHQPDGQITTRVYDQIELREHPDGRQEVLAFLVTNFTHGTREDVYYIVDDSAASGVTVQRLLDMADPPSFECPCPEEEECECHLVTGEFGRYRLDLEALAKYAFEIYATSESYDLDPPIDLAIDNAVIAELVDWSEFREDVVQSWVDIPGLTTAFLAMVDELPPSDSNIVMAADGRWPKNPAFRKVLVAYLRARLTQMLDERTGSAPGGITGYQIWTIS